MLVLVLVLVLVPLTDLKFHRFHSAVVSLPSCHSEVAAAVAIAAADAERF